MVTLLCHIVFMHNVLCFNVLNCFTWFMGNNRFVCVCVEGGRRLINEFPNKRWSVASISRMLKQESCAVAKMTMQCMGALKIFGTP